MQTTVQDINNQIIESQAYDGYSEERKILACHFRALALKRPEAIPDIVVGSGGNKPKRVTDIFVPAQFFLAQPRYSEVNHHSAGPHYTKPDEPQHYCPKGIIHANLLLLNGPLNILVLCV